MKSHQSDNIIEINTFKGIPTSLKILSLLSFCYFFIWTSNLSLKACCCYRRRLFLLSVFGIYVLTYVYHLGYIYIIYAFMFSLTNISGTVCSKKRHFEYILKRASICHVYLWKHLQISSCLALFFLISSHGVAAKPATWVAANVTGRFTARTFHSHKLAGVFWEKKSCARVNLIRPYNLECHYACIYGFNLFLTLCQPPVSVLVVDYPGRLYIYMWLRARESLGGKNKCM